MATFIQDNPIKKKRPCTTNGLMKHMERLKKISTWSVTMKYISEDPFKPYKLKFDPKEREFLDFEELTTLENFTFQDSAVQYVSELFILAVILD